MEKKESENEKSVGRKRRESKTTEFWIEIFNFRRKSEIFRFQLYLTPLHSILGHASEPNGNKWSAR